MKKKRKLKDHQQPQVHEKLKGFELKIDKLGNINSSLNLVAFTYLQKLWFDSLTRIGRNLICIKQVQFLTRHPHLRYTWIMIVLLYTLYRSHWLF